MNLKKIKLNAGMTYVELIVVLGIFSVLLAVVLFDYQKFQENIDIRNLSNQIALSVVEAQKDALSGRLNANPFLLKPAYGIYLDIGSNNKSYTYFADLNNNNNYESIGNCPAGECVDVLGISGDGFIESMRVEFFNAPPTNPNTLAVVFTRPDSMPVFHANGLVANGVSSVSINLRSSGGTTGRVIIYSSGRVQID
jgi:type II secretory pathway pseudopilin PulG